MTKNEEKKECGCGCSCKKKAIVLVGVVVLAAAAAFGACKFACCGSKVMIIDFEQVRQNAVAYKSIIDQQRSYEEKLQAKLSVDAGQLQKEEKELVEQKGKLSETDFQKKATALQKKAFELQQQYRLRAQQILLASQKAAQDIQAEVQEVLDGIATKKGAGVVLNKNIAVYADDKVDITDCFVKALNEKVKAKAYPNPETIQLPVAGGQ